jgi:tetratricopeptide (TPR) repeat protein
LNEHQWFSFPSLVFLGLVAVLCGQAVEAQERCSPWLAKAYSVVGQVDARLSGGTAWRPVKAEDTFCRGDQLRTLENSRAALELSNQTHLRLDQHTTLSLVGPEKVPASLLELVKGAIHFIARIPKSLRVNTPFASAFVEGTEFLVRAEAGRSLVVVYEGQVLTENRHGQLRLKNGEAALAEKGQPPRRYLLVQPRDAVQWALYYPPVIEPKAHEFPNLPEVQRSVALYRDGKPAEALALIQSLPPSLREPRLFIYRAGLYLYVGRVEEARRDIQTALALEPKSGDALALQSIIHLARNNKTEARRLAAQAVQLNPKSPSALLARSYAEQAYFELPKARQSIQEALVIDKDNALLWARLAELEMSEGNLDDARNAASQAVRLNPRLSRTQTVLGFAHLTRIRTAAAKQSFGEAIASDPTDPLPRLGLGLARIREGDLEEGRDEIELATTLDPGNALIRSYMGKAYYEEKRGKLASSQFDMAKDLDPKDPTPFFYDAIKKQTENRPVEALQDLQKAIELNDNRAVYRSREMLDQDLAARGAALGRIYNELGFGQRALVEGWRTITQDPSDYTSHRLLSDTYSALPRHDLARSSELLQSQLLQPINITPVQPRLAESELFLLGGLGPSALSLNEFNPLFQRDRFSFLASGLVGSNETYSDEVVHSGLWNHFSYSLGQFHYQTEGFRRNNDIDVNIYNAFAQAHIMPGLSVQGEYRRRAVDRGNLDSVFAPTPSQQSFFDNFRRESESDLYRFGVHLAPTNHSDLLGSFIHIDQSAAFGTNPGSPSVFTNRAVIGEAQHMQRSESIKSILGGGYYHLNTSESNVENSYGYLYTQIRYPSAVTWTLGLSFTLLDDSQFSKTLRSVNPKFGMLWDVTPDTVLRAAVFRTVNSARLPYQTLEPVQVSGFNQFFDDIYPTEALRWGIGLDHRFGPTFSGGVEVSRRHLDVHTLGEDKEGNLIETEARRKESFYRAYLLWAPHPSWAGTLEYFRENFEREGPLDTETQVVPVGLSYFDPSGVFAKFKANFYDQSVNLNTGTDSSEAVFLDLGLGYRLPQRHGIFEIQFQNLLDQNYHYQGLQNRRPTDTQGVPPYLPFPPEFTFFARLTLAF